MDPRMGITKREAKQAVSTSFERRSSVACKYRRTAVAPLSAKAEWRGEPFNMSGMIL